MGRIITVVLVGAALLGCEDENDAPLTTPQAQPPVAPRTQLHEPLVVEGVGTPRAEAPDYPAEPEPLDVETEADAREETKPLAPARSKTSTGFTVREYDSPGGPAGTAPVPDYPMRTESMAPAPAVSNTTVNIEQNNTTINNNVVVSPFGYREPRRRRARPSPESPEPNERRRRPLHPAVTTPVHPAVTTPVHP